MRFANMSTDMNDKSKYIQLKGEHINLQNGGYNNKKDVFLFKAEWCPHCKNFLPTWKELKKNLGQKYNFTIYDSDKNKNEIEQWKIQGFPTVIVKNKEQAYEYVGSYQYDNVLNFINNI